MATATTFKSSFITDKEAHLNFINSLHSKDLIVRNNNLALNHLTSIVPFIEDVYLNDILKIREREKESFILSRQALNEAILSFSKTNERFSEIMVVSRPTPPPYIISLFCWFAWETSAMMVKNFKLARFIAFGTCNMR
jgi:hypothetical protein